MGSRRCRTHAQGVAENIKTAALYHLKLQLTVTKEMNKINSMTPEQWAEVPRIVQRLIDLESQPIDEEAGRRWIGELYKAIGKNAPQVLFFDSPMAMHVAAAATKIELGDQLMEKLMDKLREKLGEKLRIQLRDQVGVQLWDQLMGQIGAKLWGQLMGQLRDRIMGQLKDELMGQRGAQLLDQLNTQWLSSYLGWFRGGKVAGVKFTQEEWELYCGYLENVSSILAYEKVVFASRRPVEIHWQDGVLHNESGPAVLYADGWSLYSIEGVQVDQQIVERPKTQELSQINQEENEEKKRIRISRYGWHRYLESMNATVVDVATGQWMESLMQCGNMKILCTYDPSTGRPYALEVDPSCETCQQAQRYLLAPELALQGLGIDSSKVETYPILRT